VVSAVAVVDDDDAAAAAAEEEEMDAFDHVVEDRPVE